MLRLSFVSRYASMTVETHHGWVMKNGHQHLMATITGAEGDKSAILWLQKNRLEPLAKMALVGDGNNAAFEWLKQNGHPELALVAKRIEFVKDEIERDNVDHHSINKYS